MKKIITTLFAQVFAMAMMAQHAVVIDDSTHVQTTISTATWTCRRTVLVNDAKGNSCASWGEVMNRNQKLKAFSATICDASGKTVKKLKKSDLQVSELSEGLSDDATTYFLDYKPTMYPATITYEWTVETNGAVIAYPMFSPVDDYDVPVHHAVYLIEFPADNPCRYYVSHCDSLLHIDKQPGSIKMVFSPIPAFAKEPYGLPTYKRIPRVCFAPDRFEYLGTAGRMDTWENFGKWQYELIKDRLELPAQTKAKVHELTDGCRTKREKIAKLYHYLYDNTRYVSIQLGIGGYQPAPAMEVANTGFGDCKALSNYMIALLKEAGIPAFYAAISTKYADLFDHFPSMNQINHVVVGVPMEKDTLWLECTNARYPLGYVHEGIAGHQALVISAEGGKVVRLPQYKDEDNRQTSHCHILLAKDGSAQVKVEMDVTNRQYEHLLPVILRDDKVKRDVLLSNISLPAAQVTSLQMKEEKDEPVIHATLEAKSGRYANVTGKRLFVNLNPLKADFSTLAKDDRRTSPFSLDYGYHDEEDITIVIPEGYKVEAMPQNMSMDNQFVTFVSDVKVEENEIHVRQRITLHSGDFAAKDYNEWVNAKNQIARYYRKQAVLSL